jgi:hypothetical protein
MRFALSLAGVAVCLAASACSGPVPTSEESEAAWVEPGTDGPLGKADAVEGRVELKVMLSSDQISRAQKKFGLKAGAAAERDIWFYDTTELELFDQGVILRGRNKHGEDDDSTVKLRPMAAEDVAPEWFALDGFKCEEDRSLTKSVSSCSLTVVQGENELEDIAAGDRAIDKAFSSDQEDLLATYASVPVDWDRLRPLGPVDASVWKVTPKSFSQKLTMELWELPDGSRLFEVSTRTSPEQASDLLTEMAAYLEALGFDTSAEQETKTRAALELFAAMQD